MSERRASVVRDDTCDSCKKPLSRDEESEYKHFKASHPKTQLRPICQKCADAWVDKIMLEMAH